MTHTPIDITAVRTALYHDGAEQLRQSRHYYKLMCQHAGLKTRGEAAEWAEPGDVAASMYAALASAVTFQWTTSAILRLLERESPELAQKVAGIVELVQDVGIEAIEDANDDLPYLDTWGDAPTPDPTAELHVTFGPSMPGVSKSLAAALVESDGPVKPETTPAVTS